MSNKPSGVTVKFNLVLISFLFISYFISLLFEPMNEEKVPWDTLYKAFPVLSIILAVAIALILMLWGAKLFELFWNRLISTIFKLREIGFQEALSIVLVLTIIIASLRG